ncbi:MAG TPA: O-acetyl-ADP-ribose deacetylase [Myxococcaceae bacterium]|nr:O-acetyl-ADP-ribose deacetylase [Myxococcaceae bacterium]
MGTIEVLQVDITTLAVDAIVNAANGGLRGGGGVDGAIHRGAGPELLDACRRIGGCPTGGAVLTPGFRLPARFVIHAVGPVWSGGGDGEADLLRSAYVAAFDVARSEAAVRSIAFPAISTGVYGFPRERAARIALRVMRERAEEFDRVVAALFSAADRQLYLETLTSLP